MKIRWLTRYSVGGTGSGRAGDPERRINGTQVLQAWDKKTKSWKDVPNVVDAESKQFAHQQLYGIRRPTVVPVKLTYEAKNKKA